MTQKDEEQNNSLENFLRASTGLSPAMVTFKYKILQR